MRKIPGLHLQPSLVQDNVPVEISPGLFVGSIHVAFNFELLKSNKISHVLNLAGNYATFPEDFTYLSLRIRDKEYANLLSCLPIAAIFIDAGLKHGGVLVHCAGGRSRSPAVVMAFLMMRQQMSYLAVSAHMKALRPVVSLNAGFDAQLKYLDTARGNVFVANQHLLKARLAHLVDHQRNDENVQEIKKTRSQSCQSFPLSPQMLLASGCDKRSMLGERIPTGFCLSLPSDGHSVSKTTPGGAFSSSFIPALRSMGTMFGCQQCGESLFCAGSIVYPYDIATLTSNPEKSRSADGTCTRFFSALRKEMTNSSADNEQAANTSNTKKDKLMKMRLRPQSPSLTIGSGSRLVSAADRPKGKKEIQAQPHHILQPMRCPAKKEDKCPDSTARKVVKRSGTRLWRSLAYFTKSKRTTKAPLEEKSTHSQKQKCTITSELQKPAILSSIRSEDVHSSKIGHTHSDFFDQNIVEWYQKIQQLVNSSKRSSKTTNMSMVEQMATILDEDSAVFMELNDCTQWFIEPQSWMISQVSSHPEGTLCCSRETCRSIVGEWHWKGLRNAGGDCITPAFIMKRDAVCVLGNTTSLVE